MPEAAGAGAPVSVVIIGVDNLSDSLALYRDRLGLEVTESRRWQGPEFEAYWRLPAGASAQTAFLAAGPDPVGRVLLMEFAAGRRRRVREPAQRRAVGLFNLNFYTRDIALDHRDFSRLGVVFWSEPAHNDFGPTVGESIEVVFEGPDSVPINLVQLVTRNPDTMIGGIRTFVEQYGRTRAGYTPVVTTAHGVAAMDRAIAFYDAVLGMEVAMDTVLEAPETNRFLSLPEDARTRSVFVQGNHPFGKIALSSPINYDVPSLVEHAVPPNIGYLAQAFRVDSLDAAAGACASVDAEVFTPPIEIDLPGRGPCRSMVVRNPGSGALQEIFESA